MKFHKPNENIHLEGTMSQNVYLGPSCHFMKCKKNNDEKNNKNFPFFCIKIKLGPISIF